MNFYFVVYKINNKKFFDSFNAKNLNDLLNQFDKNSELIYIKEIPSYLSYFLNMFKPKASIIELIEFLKNIALMLNSGITFSEIITDLKIEQKSKAIKLLLKDIENSLNNGETFSDSLKRTFWIPDVVPNMISIGEQNGKLPNSLEKCSKYLEKNYFLKKNMIQALIYPVSSFLVVMFAFFFWLLYVLPKMIDFFKSMNIKTPYITEVMFIFSNWLKSSYFIPFIFLSVFTLIIYIFIKRPKKIAKHIDNIILKIPLVGKIIIYYNSAYISEAISLYLNSGYGIYECLKSLEKNLNNNIYKSALKNILEEVIEGKQLYEAFSDTKKFPLYFIRMLKTAEKSGNLDQQMQFVSNEYYSKIEYIANNIQKIIVPFIMFFVAFFIITILLVFIGPVYDSFINLK